VRGTPRALKLIVVIACLQTLAWNLALPPLQGPDEAGHVAYVQHLAETGHAPVVNGAGKPNSTEEDTALVLLGLGPMLGNLSGRAAWPSVDRRAWAAFENHVTHQQRSDGAAQNPLAKNGPLYYAIDAIPYRLIGGAFFTRLFFMRLYSGLLYVLAVICVYLLAAELFSSQWPRVVAAGAVVLQPQLAFISGIVNPDIQLCAIWSAFALFAVRALRRGPSPARMVGLGLLVGSSALTHGRGLALIGPGVLVTALLLLRYRPALRPAAIFASLAVGAAALLVFLAFRYTSTHGGGQAFGGEVSQANVSIVHLSLRGFLSYLWQFYLPRLSFMGTHLGPPYGYRQVYIETFYATFGSLEVVLRPKYYDLLQVASAVGVFALYTTGVARWRRLVAQWEIGVVLASMAISMILLLHIAAFHDLSAGSQDPLITGRYLLPLIPLFGLAIAFVARSLPGRLGPAFGGAVLAVGAVLSIAGLGLTVTRFYA